jgi:6-phosphofructo-2-kinase / fructose-2,6-biphosphatase 4
LIELEREQEDLLIIGHASVIRCLLAYLIGLPATEIPAIEIARGDLIEVVPASYGVHSHAYHFWDGPGRHHAGPGDGLGGGNHSSYDWQTHNHGHAHSHGDGDGDHEAAGSGGGGGGGVHYGERDRNNFYENYAEDTKGKRTNRIITIESAVSSPVIASPAIKLGGETLVGADTDAGVGAGVAK